MERKGTFPVRILPQAPTTSWAWMLRRRSIIPPVGPADSPPHRKRRAAQEGPMAWLAWSVAILRVAFDCDPRFACPGDGTPVGAGPSARQTALGYSSLERRLQ